MALQDLCSLDEVKTWLGVTTTTSDQMLQRLITQVSNVILSYLNRQPLYSHTVVETRSVVGICSSIMLREWPVTKINSLSVSDTAITAAASVTSSGFVLQAWDGQPPGSMQQLALNGYGFTPGLNTVVLSYVAGYLIANEAATIPSTAEYQITAAQPYGAWSYDNGVTFANGTALVYVSENPTTGQYSFVKGSRVYQFADVDAGKAVLLSYSYTPFDLAEICMEIVGERVRYRDRIGQASHSAGGQTTVSYSLKDMQDYQKLALNPYRRVAPV